MHNLDIVGFGCIIPPHSGVHEPFLLVGFVKNSTAEVSVLASTLAN